MGNRLGILINFEGIFTWDFPYSLRYICILLVYCLGRWGYTRGTTTTFVVIDMFYEIQT